MGRTPTMSPRIVALALFSAPTLYPHIVDLFLIPLLAACIAAITLLSGFGLGTVLMPVFALFFPIEIAIAATGVVHLSNNLFILAALLASGIA